MSIEPADLSITFVCAEIAGDDRDGEPAVLLVVSNEEGAELGQAAFCTESVARLHAMLGAWLANGGRPNGALKIAFLEAGAEPMPRVKDVS